MPHSEILARIESKIALLGEAKRELEAQAARLREENASLYRINKELQTQIDDLTEKNRELETTRSLQVEAPEDFRAVTRQRINELVNEIDDCIALLNK